MTPTICTCTNLRRAARHVSDVYDAALVPTGLGVAQLALLRAIARLGAPTITGLAVDSGLDRSTLGRNLRVLEKEGLVTLPAGRDARSRTVMLTDDARRRLDAAAPLWDDAQQTIEAALGAAGVAALQQALVALTDLPMRQGDHP